MSAEEDFELLEQETAPYYVGNRTRSTALLAWFMENVWREDPDIIEDAICDGGGDKGIDAILVDRDAKEIAVLQAKHRARAGVTQGDADLKALRGVAPYFNGPDGVQTLLDSGPNEELTKLIERLELERLISEEEDYSVRLVMVTNATSDASADDYLEAVQGDDPPLGLWDRDDLVEIASRTQRPELLPGNYTLTPSSEVLVEELTEGVEMAVALVPAAELIRLPGIEDRTLFHLNVRLGLGRTRINKELGRTVEQADEHPVFPAYHNGLTLLTDELDVTDDGVELSGVSVVNGCQSLIALYSKRSSLTPDLKLMTKVVQLGDESGLADKITYRSNNQNPVNIRDQRANDRIQRDLQAQVGERYGTRLFYAIRRGDTSKVADATLDNQLAAQLIVALYLKEPWNAVRKVRLFDEDYHRIFSRHLNADRLFLAHLVDQLVEGRRAQLRDELNASFASVRFTITHVTAQVAGQSDLGEELFERPERWLPDQEVEVRAELDRLVEFVVNEVNDYVEDREDESHEDEEAALFDPKVAFKSRTAIRPIERQAVRSTRPLARKDPEFLFHLEPHG